MRLLTYSCVLLGSDGWQQAIDVDDDAPNVDDDASAGARASAIDVDDDAPNDEELQRVYGVTGECHIMLEDAVLDYPPSVLCFVHCVLAI